MVRKEGTRSISTMWIFCEGEKTEIHYFKHLRSDLRIQKLQIKDLEYDEDLFTSINNVFDKMPIAAVISNKIFCVHAGIPGPVKLSEITKDGAYPFVWNDPFEMDGIGESPHGLGMRTFGEDVFDGFFGVGLMGGNMKSFLIHNKRLMFIKKSPKRNEY